MSILILPKITIQGKFVMTAIKRDDISGMEPSEVKYNGRKMIGTKVYVDKGRRFFKVFANPNVLVQAWNATLLTGKVTTVDPLMLPAGVNKVEGMQPMKALPHAIKG